MATGTGVNYANITCSGSKTLDAAGTWNWTLRLQTSGPAGSPSGTQLDAGSTTVNAATTAVTFSFSNLIHTYDGNMKTASVSPNPGNATYSADLTKGPGVGSYTVSATGTGSFVGSGSDTLIIDAAPDTTPPSTPGNVHVTAFDQNSVTFAWNAASDNVGVTGYQVRLNQGSPVSTGSLSHTFSGLANNTNYLLEVSARDAAGNWSGWGGATASTGGSGGGGSGASASFWIDVNGDGIRDEVVKAGTNDFNYTIDWWYTEDATAWNLQVNVHWTGWSIFNPDDQLWWTNHAVVWAGEAYINPTFQTTFGVSFTIAPRSGRQMSIFMDPAGSSTANPGSWVPLQQNMGPIGQNPFTYSQPFYTTGDLDGTPFYLAHLGTPVASLQFRDFSGNILIDNVAVDGVADLFLPANNQITLGVRDTIGEFISSGHQILWKILNSVGTVLRQGLGINVDFDNLDLAQIAQLSVTLDTAAEKRVTVRTFEIKQLNFPSDPNSTDLGQPTEKLIGENGIAYIRGLPAVAQLQARVNNPPTNATSIEWRMDVSSERSERGQRDNIGIPSQGVVELPKNQAWHIHDTYSGFIGGNCTIRYRLKGASGYVGDEKTFSFKIRGKNPKDAEAKQYVQSIQGSYRFLWAMIQHESRQGQRIYNQFNSTGNLIALPNYGQPDGWGIAQIEGASTSGVYDWKSNAQAALAVLSDKLDAQQRFFDAVARTYPNDTEAQTPPTSYTPPGTQTVLTAMEAGMITLYNGSGGCPQSILIGPSGSNVTYQNPWQFTPTNPSGQKWSFTPNSTNYLYKIIYDEVEGHSQNTE